MQSILDKDYLPEDLADVERDIWEAIIEADVPDEGYINIQILWKEGEDNE